MKKKKNERNENSIRDPMKMKNRPGPFSTNQFSPIQFFFSANLPLRDPVGERWAERAVIGGEGRVDGRVSTMCRRFYPLGELWVTWIY